MKLESFSGRSIRMLLLSWMATAMIGCSGFREKSDSEVALEAIQIKLKEMKDSGVANPSLCITSDNRVIRNSTLRGVKLGDETKDVIRFTLSGVGIKACRKYISQLKVRTSRVLQDKYPVGSRGIDEHDHFDLEWDDYENAAERLYSQLTMKERISIGGEIVELP